MDKRDDIANIVVNEQIDREIERVRLELSSLPQFCIMGDITRLGLSEEQVLDLVLLAEVLMKISATACRN